MSDSFSGPLIVLEPEGLYQDTVIESEILSASLSQHSFEIHQAHLGEERPYNNLPVDLRARVHGLFVFKHWFSAQDLELFPQLRVLVRMGVGYDRLDRIALDKKGVIVCNCPGLSNLFNSGVRSDRNNDAWQTTVRLK
jgi:C-terminal binding protein